MKMTEKEIKYVLLFQNKLSSKAGPHMSVSVICLVIVHLPLAVVATYFGGMLWIQNNISAPFVAFTITKGEGAFYFCVVCIFPSSHLYFWQVPF